MQLKVNGLQTLWHPSTELRYLEEEQEPLGKGVSPKRSMQGRY